MRAPLRLGAIIFYFLVILLSSAAAPRVEVSSVGLFEKLELPLAPCLTTQPCFLLILPGGLAFSVVV